MLQLGKADHLHSARGIQPSDFQDHVHSTAPAPPSAKDSIMGSPSQRVKKKGLRFYQSNQFAIFIEVETAHWGGVARGPRSRQ